MILGLLLGEIRSNSMSPKYTMYLTIKECNDWIFSKSSSCTASSIFTSCNTAGPSIAPSDWPNWRFRFPFQFSGPGFVQGQLFITGHSDLSTWAVNSLGLASAPRNDSKWRIKNSTPYFAGLLEVSILAAHLPALFVGVTVDVLECILHVQCEIVSVNFWKPNCIV